MSHNHRCLHCTISYLARLAGDTPSEVLFLLTCCFCCCNGYAKNALKLSKKSVTLVTMVTVILSHLCSVWVKENCIYMIQVNCEATELHVHMLLKDMPGQYVRAIPLKSIGGGDLKNFQHPLVTFH